MSVESRQAFSPLRSQVSVSSAIVLSNKLAQSTSRVSCLKAVTLKSKKKREFSGYTASLYAIISIRSVLCSISESYKVPFIELAEWQK